MRDAVPAFFLYGEPVQEADTRFLHMESIDVRSRPADWTIRAHAHRDLNHLMFVLTGGGEMRAEASSWPFAAPSVLVCPAGSVHGFQWRPKSDGHVLTIAEPYLRELAARWPDCRSLFEAPRVLSMTEQDFVAHGFGPALERLGRELVWSAPGRSMAIEGCLSAIMAGLLRVSAIRAVAGAVHPRAALVARFREAVEQRFRSGAPLAAYAAALGVTESRLRAACLEVVRTSPMALVRDRIMLEAKRMLLYTDLSVAQAAWELGFEDAAYFSRFFTAREGRSPTAFRAGAGPA
jgi:AraC family transcriptional activator of pobA